MDVKYAPGVHIHPAKRGYMCTPLSGGKTPLLGGTCLYEIFYPLQGALFFFNKAKVA